VFGNRCANEVLNARMKTENRSKLMKRIMILFGMVCTVGISISVYAKDKVGDMESMMQHHHMMHQMESTTDKRTSLHLPEQMKAEQLANMRSHLEAVRNIVGLISENKFDEASGVAHNKLGLTPKMKKMCNMFDNDNFRSMGLAFHKSADKLGDVLKTGDIKRSLAALHNTMNSCVQCHATFRQ